MIAKDVISQLPRADQINLTPLISIGVFRCKSCGFLESYAGDEFPAK
jgi:hypothetical protein